MLVPLALVGCELTDAADRKQTVVFSDLNWTSAQFQNRVAQYILEKGCGYPTEVAFGGALPLFQGACAAGTAT